MLKRYYAIYDKVAKSCSGLFEQQNDAVASRLFESQQKNKDSFISLKQIAILFKIIRFGFYLA